MFSLQATSMPQLYTSSCKCRWILLFTLVVALYQVQCVGCSRMRKDNERNKTLALDDEGYNIMDVRSKGLEEYARELTDLLFSGRKKGGGGGGATGMFFMRTLMDMFNATVPMMAMTIMGWMKDIMMMGAGAFMMMMYDMLRKGGEQKKIIIKLPPQPPPEPAPPAQTGYGPWEGK